MISNRPDLAVRVRDRFVSSGQFEPAAPPIIAPWIPDLSGRTDGRAACLCAHAAFAPAEASAARRVDRPSDVGQAREPQSHRLRSRFAVA